MNNPGIRLTLMITETLSRYPEGVSFSDLLRLLHNLPEATFSRVLRLLAEENWIEKDTGGLYRHGPGFRTAACRYVSDTSGNPALGPVVRKLAEETGQSAAFAMWYSDGIRFHFKHEMPESFHYIDIGKTNTHNLYNGFNIVCLAYLPEREAHAVFAEPVPLGTVFRDDEEFLSACGNIRRDRFYISRDTALRFIAPVFYGGLGKTGTEGKSENTSTVLSGSTHAGFAGAIGITLLPGEIPPEREERFRAAVQEAASYASNILIIKELT